MGAPKRNFKSSLHDSDSEEQSMPYIHEGWTLYKRDVTLKGGRKQTIYFFSKRSPKSGTACELPAGYAVGVNKRTGIPYLKKK